MSEKMGPLTYGSKEEQVFLGRDFNAQKNFSDETAKLIDLEVKALVMGGYNTRRGSSHQKSGVIGETFSGDCWNTKLWT